MADLVEAAAPAAAPAATMPTTTSVDVLIICSEVSPPSSATFTLDCARSLMDQVAEAAGVLCGDGGGTWSHYLAAARGGQPRDFLHGVVARGRADSEIVEV